MNPVLRDSAAHVIVASLDVPEADPDDAHHLFRVLRLRDGETVTVTDGEGGWRPTAVAGGALRPMGDIVREPAPPSCTIATAIPKGDRLDWMLQKLTEVGVERIVLVDCARSVVRWQPDRAERQLTRARRVMREAASQSRRVWMPVLDGPVSFAAVASLPGAMLADPDGEPQVTGSCVLIGPEGGFSPEERAAGLPLVRLGDTVLRVETAALVAAVRLLTSA